MGNGFGILDFGFFSHWILHWKGDSFNRGEREEDAKDARIAAQFCLPLVLVTM